MPKQIALDECRRLIDTKNWDAFIGCVESAHLEFKGEPYRLDSDSQKQELAKDVSALANADGGLILIGFKTTKDMNVFGDYVAELRPIPNGMFNPEQCRDIIDNWIYPAPTAKPAWVPYGKDCGFGVIDVGAADPAKRPLLLKRALTQDGKRNDIVIGYCERSRDAVKSKSVEEIHSILRAGLSNLELSSRYQLIQETLQQLVEAQSQASRSETVASLRRAQEASFARDKREAVAAAEFENIPNLLLAA